MKLLLKAAALLLVTMATAQASCPPYSPYGCVQTANGKMRCGCGVR